MEIHKKLEINKDYQTLMRYMDISKFLDFLITGSFHFTRLADFEDKSEAISQRQLIKYFKHDIDLGITKKSELKLGDRQKRYFANCWFSGKRESIGMWSIYANRSSIALKISFDDFMSFWTVENLTVNKAKEWIDHIYIDRVYYKNYLSGKDILKFKDETKIIGFQKDVSYEHEKEIRVLLKCCGIREEVLFSTQNIFNFKIKPLNIIDVPIKLIFHPLMSDWEKGNIKQLIKKYDFLNIQVCDSEVSPLLKGLE